LQVAGESAKTDNKQSMCQKTLHNFRTALNAEPELGQALFADVTKALCETLGVDTSRQRMDSTQVMSNIARLKRMGLFCETIRTFLRRLRKKMPEAYEQIPGALIGRYLKDDGKASRYEDAPRSELNRRLGVAARDVWRLIDRFRDEEKVTRTARGSRRPCRKASERTAWGACVCAGGPRCAARCS